MRNVSGDYASLSVSLLAVQRYNLCHFQGAFAVPTEFPNATTAICIFSNSNNNNIVIAYLVPYGHEKQVNSDFCLNHAMYKYSSSSTTTSAQIVQQVR